MARIHHSNIKPGQILASATESLLEEYSSSRPNISDFLSALVIVSHVQMELKF